MSQYAAGVLTSAGSTTLPIISLYGSASVKPRILEIGLFNAGAATVALKLVRLTTTGTQGTALTAAPLISDDVAAVASARTTHTVAPTLGNDLGYRTSLAVGGGVIWTWADLELTLPVTANAGIGVIVENGTGQVCQAYIKWRE